MTECFSDHMDRQPQAQPQAEPQRAHVYAQEQVQIWPQLESGPSAIFTEAEPVHLRSDVRNVMVLDPEDGNYDRRYFEAATVGHR